MTAAVQDHEARIARSFARDRELLRFFNHATLGASILTVVILLTLAIPMGRTSIWLIGLSAYATATRLLVFVARYALRAPLFLLELDSNDPATAAAARSVFEDNRQEIALGLLTAGNDHPTAERIRTLAPEEAAGIARERDLPGRRRTGVICVASWCIVSVAIWTVVVVTGGGPVYLTGAPQSGNFPQ
jgi:hypothetical protein